MGAPAYAGTPPHAEGTLAPQDEACRGNRCQRAMRLMHLARRQVEHPHCGPVAMLLHARLAVKTKEHQLH